MPRYQQRLLSPRDLHEVRDEADRWLLILSCETMLMDDYRCHSSHHRRSLPRRSLPYDKILPRRLPARIKADPANTGRRWGGDGPPSPPA